MGQVIPRQHPAVVLKSHYKAVRALLAAALVAIVALAAAVVILANDDNVKVSAQPNAHQQQIAAARHPLRRRSRRGHPRHRGRAAAPPPGTRFDGGPDEGTARQPQSYWSRPAPAPATSPRRTRGSRRAPAARR